MLDNESATLGGQNPSLHDLGGDNSLFGIEIGGRLIDQIDIARLTESQGDSNSLQLTTR